MKYKLIKVYDGFIIQAIDSHDRKIYVSGCMRDTYKYTTDYTYARHFQKDTAKTH